MKVARSFEGSFQNYHTNKAAIDLSKEDLNLLQFGAYLMSIIQPLAFLSSFIEIIVIRMCAARKQNEFLSLRDTWPAKKGEKSKAVASPKTAKYTVVALHT